MALLMYHAATIHSYVKANLHDKDFAIIGESRDNLSSMIRRLTTLEKSL